MNRGKELGIIKLLYIVFNLLIWSILYRKEYNKYFRCIAIVAIIYNIISVPVTIVYIFKNIKNLEDIDKEEFKKNLHKGEEDSFIDYNLDKEDLYE